MEGGSWLARDPGQRILSFDDGRGYPSSPSLAASDSGLGSPWREARGGGELVVMRALSRIAGYRPQGLGGAGPFTTSSH